MATQTGIINFTGRLGNVIGYRVGDKYHLRSMPEQVRQSPRSKISGRQFGKASRLGAAMRHALQGLMDSGRESATVNQLNKTLLAVLRADDLHRTKRFIPRHFQTLKGFSFNPHASLENLLPVTPDVTRRADGSIEVTVPPMDRVKGNPRATHVCIKAVAVSVGKHFTSATGAQSEPVLLPVRKPSEAFTLVVPAAPDALCCVMLEVTSLVMENGRIHLLQNRKYTAAEVIAVLPPLATPHAGHHTRHSESMRRDEALVPYVPGLIIHSPQRE
ncbi:hypothetical protein EGT74_15355 [Chitinophaga lutea]|uniref:Uncharacterized protein n=1 Tax=Chitinophaga lutea TaxID=2488634 RepID=A0A3N4Q9M9_9BACT|nr:hypothetical protein [Chitinophaga lutea]RPE08424.1 hypothetical protein EGT74_15355 [Chitinophaga lutea]